jgi:hypothetical protein
MAAAQHGVIRGTGTVIRKADKDRMAREAAERAKRQGQRPEGSK